MRLLVAFPLLLVALLPPPAQAATGDLAAPATKEIAMELVSSAENSSLDWRAQFSYIEDIGDGRGYTAGIIGFCSGTGDMLRVVRAYTRAKPGNRLARFLPALRRVNDTDSHRGLGRPFVKAWRKAAHDPAFQRAQERERDTGYFRPAVRLAKSDGLGALGQFIYYDAAVVHGVDGMKGVRRRALRSAATPGAGGSETSYLEAFLDERVVEMKKEAPHENVDRVELAQRRFLHEGNLGLTPPLRWSVYGDAYEILR
ncbi:chitosanase [Nocardioides sp. BE266]|uniref:chitosanase n=1 Tax=Nocardioides sp. BE266 TaxID=2817725 RepID=UPI00286B06EC|nr:chitosanase [Nocardioides sp. BE266]